ncbi:hypothetical protein SESBI_27404 [Sesbania bispinosa]|nr:hypothetical protein SESBI_27404 [Sesbania bispinosa]
MSERSPLPSLCNQPRVSSPHRSAAACSRASAVTDALHLRTVAITAAFSSTTAVPLSRSCVSSSSLATRPSGSLLLPRSCAVSILTEQSRAQPWRSRGQPPPCCEDRSAIACSRASAVTDALHLRTVAITAAFSSTTAVPLSRSCVSSSSLATRPSGSLLLPRSCAVSILTEQSRAQPWRSRGQPPPRRKDRRALMSKEDRDAFNRRYGRILDLLAIRVKTKSLSALAQFWNTDLRCFELPNLDMVPTIEEYGLMVRLPVKEKEVVYQYKGRYVDEKKIAKLIGLLPNQLKFEKRGSILGLRRTFLEDRLKVLAEQGHWKHFKITLALTIYGLILFPFTSDMVDQAAMDVFFQFEENGANPVPAILADTFLSMMVCHQKKGRSLRCCSHMLYVWIMTHLYARHTMGPSPDPLRDFDSVPTKDFDARGWNEEFSHTKDNQITWVCPWYHFEGVIFSCGNFPNIPLMGPRGCVAYTPSIVLRQLKCTQIKPVEESLGGASFLYGTDDVGLLIEEIKSAWGDIKWKGEKELGKTRVIASPEYKEWRKARGVPPPTPMEAVHNEASPATLSQIITTMTSEAERMKAQMTFMEEKADVAGPTNNNPRGTMSKERQRDKRFAE